MNDRTYPFDEDLLGDLDWLGSLIDIGEKFTVTGFMLCMAVGVRENCPREGSHRRSNRGPRTGLRDKEFALMQAVVRQSGIDASLVPSSDEFVDIVCRYANGGLLRLKEELANSEDQRSKLVLYLRSLSEL